MSLYSSPQRSWYGHFSRSMAAPLVDLILEYV